MRVKMGVDGAIPSLSRRGKASGAAAARARLYHKHVTTTSVHL